VNRYDEFVHMALEWARAADDAKTAGEADRKLMRAQIFATLAVAAATATHTKGAAVPDDEPGPVTSVRHLESTEGVIWSVLSMAAGGMYVAVCYVCNWRGEPAFTPQRAEEDLLAYHLYTPEHIEARRGYVGGMTAKQSPSKKTGDSGDRPEQDRPGQQQDPSYPSDPEQARPVDAPQQPGQQQPND
jgi:hypothetical protein